MRTFALAVRIMLALLGLAVCAGGYYLFHRITDEVENAVATSYGNELSIATSAIVGNAPAPRHTIRFAAADLTLWGSLAHASGTAVPVTPSALWFYGGSLLIDERGMTLLYGPSELHSGTPAVVDGALVLTDLQIHDDSVEFVFIADDYARFVAAAFARTFDEYGLTPTAVTFHDGVLEVTVTPED